MDPLSAQFDAGPQLFPSFDGAFSGIGLVPPQPAWATGVDHPLRPVCTKWLEKIRLAMEFKWANFGKDAAECMRFFAGPYDFMYNRKYATESSDFTMSEGSNFPEPTFRMTHNKVAELVQIFGPVLYHQNPDRQVNPRKLPKLPMPPIGPMTNPLLAQQVMMVQQMQQMKEMQDATVSELLQWLLNYTPTELGLAREMRFGIDEALIKGMGTLWTELASPIGSGIRLPGTFYKTVDDVVLDPDAEDLRHCKWIAVRCVHPVWEVEKYYNLPPNTLRANFESFNQQAGMNVEPDGDYARKKGKSNDLFVYWKVYSKMGVGGRLEGVPFEMRGPLDQFGDFVYIVVADNTPFPLNAPPPMLAAQGGIPAIGQALQWPTPLYLNEANFGGWPFTPIAYHWIPRKLWPMSHMKPAMGELKFLNWVYSFIASKVQIQSRDFIAMKKSLGDQIKETILHGKNYTLIEIDEHHQGTITELVQFLQHPTMNGDIWQVIDRVTANFEKRTGLTELIYGETSRQMRSAEEANLKGDQLQIRPDDMSRKTEEVATETARKEAIVARWHLTPADIAPLMGDHAAMVWGQVVSSSNIFVISHQLEYRIEAGSTKKPNRDRDIANMNQATQTLLQPLMNWAMHTGQVQPLNALAGDWCKARGLDPQRYVFLPQIVRAHV